MYTRQELPLRIALLEDDPDQAELMRRWLSNADYVVEWYADGAGFLRGVRRDSFDLYVLDWVLPDLSGIEVLRRLRGDLADFTPVVIATAKNEEAYVVRGLEAGADDYLVKPVRQGELIARLAAIFRRAAGVQGSSESLDATPYRVDEGRQTFDLHGDTVSLTNKEFELALFLFRNAGKMLSRSHILESIWGIDNKSVSTRTVDTHVSRLRKKLRLREDNGWKLSAVYQHGYRLERV